MICLHRRTTGLYPDVPKLQQPLRYDKSKTYVYIPVHTGDFMKKVSTATGIDSVHSKYILYEISCSSRDVMQYTVHISIENYETDCS